MGWVESRCQARWEQGTCPRSLPTGYRLSGRTKRPLKHLQLEMQKQFLVLSARRGAHNTTAGRAPAPSGLPLGPQQLVALPCTGLGVEMNGPCQGSQQRTQSGSTPRLATDLGLWAWQPAPVAVTGLLSAPGTHETVGQGYRGGWG